VVHFETTPNFQPGVVEYPEDWKPSASHLEATSRKVAIAEARKRFTQSGWRVGRLIAVEER
jgi:hypothetical protein